MDDGSRLWLCLSAGIVSIILMAVFTVFETAVVEVNDAKVRKNAENDARWARLLKMSEKPRRTMTAMATFRIFMTCIAVFSCAEALRKPVSARITKLFDSNSEAVQIFVGALTLLAIILVVTIVVSALGIALPKRIGAKNPDVLAPKVCGALNACAIVFAPLSALVSAIAYGFGRIFGLSEPKGKETVTEEEILMMVDAVNETGGIESSQREMISNIFEFGDIEVGEVMTHRTEICAVEAGSNIREVVLKVIDEGFSRIPVYENTVDNIIGVVFAKDLLKLIFAENPDAYTVRSLMREILYVPETNNCDELFGEFTQTKSQIAVAVDEYGGTAGIVTMEDLLEAIVGNIQDEYDDEAEEITAIDDTTFKILGTANPDDVMDVLGLELPEEHDYDTIGGFIIDLLGYIPEDDTHPECSYENVNFRAEKISEKRIEELTAHILEEKDEQDGISEE